VVKVAEHTVHNGGRYITGGGFGQGTAVTENDDAGIKWVDWTQGGGVPSWGD